MVSDQNYSLHLFSFCCGLLLLLIESKMIYLFVFLKCINGAFVDQKCDKYVMSRSLLFERCLGELLIMLYPMAPHMASELWEYFQSAPNRLDVEEVLFRWDQPISAQVWPSLDSQYQLELFCKVR